MLFIYSDKFNQFVCRYFLINESQLYAIPKAVIWFLFSLFVLYVFYKFLIKRYLASKLLWHVIISFLIFYILIKFLNLRDGWTFISLTSSGVKYIDLVGIAAGLSFILLIVQKIKRDAVTYTTEQNIFVADDPIKNSDEDKLGYSNRVKYVINHIKESSFRKSFTIGVVGPWGSGKSSFIALFKKELEKNPIKDTHYFKFLPSLNHNENDIILEFFKQLGSEIKKYSGGLSNDIIDYAGKLLNLYTDKNISSFLDPNHKSKTNKSVQDLYTEINDTLEILNKKFIIFIDDLDRLSNSEILQVLKLVRNSANFRNFIFFVALDKDYMLKTLLTRNDILDYTFVNKFFQLEVHLPEINKSDLKHEFLILLKKSSLGSDSEFILEAEKSINDSHSLFEDYVINMRDVKRLINQLLFDYRLLPDELRVNDFINFTCFKINFPAAIIELTTYRHKILEYKPEKKVFELRKKQEEGNNNKINYVEVLDLFRIRSNASNEPDYTKYSNILDLKRNELLKENTNFTYGQSLLYLKSLIFLFGEENHSNDTTSIKYENNLRKLLQQKLLETDLDEVSFKRIFDWKKDDFNQLKWVLKKVGGRELLSRMDFFNTNDQFKAEEALIVLLYVFDNAVSYELNIYEVWEVLGHFMERTLKLDNIDKKKIWATIDLEFFDNKEFSTIAKIYLIKFINENKDYVGFKHWELKGGLKEKNLTLFKEYMQSIKKTTWAVGDYTFIHIYNTSSEINGKEKINPIVIEYLENKYIDIRLFAAQATNLSSTSAKGFNTSYIPERVFGAKESYFEFVKAHFSEEDGLNEYIKFLEIERITNFSIEIWYEFREFDLMQQRIENLRASNPILKSMDTSANQIELILKGPKEFMQIMQTNLHADNIPGFLYCPGLFVQEDKVYIFLRIESGKLQQAKKDIFKHYRKLLEKKEEIVILKSDFKLKVENYPVPIAIYSIQPSSYS